MNYKSMNFMRGSQYVVNLNIIPHKDVFREIPEINVSTPNKIISISAHNYDDIFEKICNSKDNYAKLFYFLSELHSLIKNGNIVPYFQSFNEYKINYIIVGLLKVKQIDDIQFIIEIMNQLIYSSDKYLYDLVDANVIPNLIDLYYDRSDIYITIIKSFSLIAQKNKDFKDEIYGVVDIERLFTFLLDSMAPKQQKDACLKLLDSFLRWNDFQDEFIQMCLFYLKKLLEQWKCDPYLTRDIIDIIFNTICDFQTPNQQFNTNVYELFQSYSREIQLVDIILSTIEEIFDCVQNYNDPEYPKNDDGSDAEKIKIKIMYSIFCRLLDFVGIYFEKPVDFQLNLQFFIDLANTDDKKIRCLTLFLIGNMFESMPETINMMMSLEFFNLVDCYIEESDNETRMESYICCSTAICFCDNETRNYFIENGFLSQLFETISTLDDQILYMLVNAITRMIETINIEKGPYEALEAFREASEDDISTIQFSVKNNAKAIEALDKMMCVVNGIAKSIEE